jgi:hypothetical protein
VRMYLPTALFVGCLIALNYILPHGSGTGSTGRNHQKALRIAGPPSGMELALRASS